jgi:enoyl-CoA hydratase/carnithine racemase
VARRPTYFDKYETVAFERHDDGVLIIRLHSEGGPVKYCTKHHEEWAPAFTDVGMDRDNRVVVITGTGASFIDGMHQWDEHNKRAADKDISRWNETYMINRLLDIEAPVIGVANGPARLHAEILLLSDITLAADTSVFADDGHFWAGKVPGDGVEIVWPELLGPNRGRYFLLAGKDLSAQDALVLGVVNEVLPMAELMPRALDLAHEMATMSDLVLRYTRIRLIQRWKKLFSDASSVGYGMVLIALSDMDINDTGARGPWWVTGEPHG